VIASNIAKRYARALYDIAAEEKALEKYGSEIETFSELIETSRDLQHFMSDPVFDETQKKAVVGELIAKSNLSEVTANFLNLLVDKRRIGILPEIKVAYRELIDAILKNVRVSVQTAMPLSDELTKSLEERLAAMTGKTVVMTVEKDPSLLGGIVVAIGDTRHDGSIRTQLDKIRNLLGEEK
jgi:F-type H+-transporting ATPase subunit delta